MSKADNLAALGSNVTTDGNLSSNSTLRLQTNSTTAVTVDASQNVGIGTASPAAKLEVQGSVRIGNATAHGSLTMPDLIGNPILSLVTDTATAGSCTIVNNWGSNTNIGVVVGTVRNDGTAFQVQTAIPITSGLPSGSGTSMFTVGGDGNITVAKAARGTITTDNDLSFDMNAASNFKCTPTALGTLTFTNITAGQSGFILLVNTGGYAISAAATTEVSSGTLTTISTAGTYLLSYFSDGTNVFVTNSGAMA